MYTKKNNKLDKVNYNREMVKQEKNSQTEIYQ